MPGHSPFRTFALPTGRNPVLDPPNEPAAHPTLLGIRLGPAELKGATNAARAPVVPPLEASAVPVEAGVLLPLVVEGAEELPAHPLRVEGVVLLLGDVEALGLADVGAGGGGHVGAPLDDRLLLLRLLAAPVLLAGAGLALLVWAYEAEVVGHVVPVLPGWGQMRLYKLMERILYQEIALWVSVLVL